MSWRLAIRWTCLVLAAVLLTRASTRLFAQEPSLADILAKAAREAAVFADPARLIECDERYQQINLKVRALVGFSTGTGAGPQNQVEGVPTDKREWIADLVVVATPDNEPLGQPWMEFRDILTVNGKAMHNGVSRLGALASKPISVAGVDALKYTRDNTSQRFGRFIRGPLLPRLIQLVFHASNQKRFDLRKGGARVIDGIKTIEVKFQEKAKPSIFGASDGSDTFLEGSAWIDPENGHVVQSLLKNGDSDTLKNEMTVTYGLDQESGLWVPKDMKDVTIDNDEGTRVEATGTFTKWRIVPRTAR